jgi:hypothetical protein
MKGQVLSVAPMKPPAELEALDYFVGIWTCNGKLEATADGPARITRGTMICRWELGKHYLGVAEDDELSLEQPKRRQIRAYWGYDAGAKQYTCAAFFFGGGRFIGTSPGWRGDVLTFAGDMITGGERVAVRKSFHHKSDDEMVIRIDIVGPDGERTRRLEETCRRQADD